MTPAASNPLRGLKQRRRSSKFDHRQRALVLERRDHPGEKLVVAELAEIIGMSRQNVHSAIKFAHSRRLPWARVKDVEFRAVGWRMITVTGEITNGSSWRPMTAAEKSEASPSHPLTPSPRHADMGEARSRFSHDANRLPVNPTRIAAVHAPTPRSIDATDLLDRELVNAMNLAGDYAYSPTYRASAAAGVSA